MFHAHWDLFNAFCRVPASILASGMRLSSLSWSYCVQKSDDICLNQASGVFQRLHPNTEQISLLISAKTPLGSGFPLIKICAGRGLGRTTVAWSIKAQSEAWAAPLTSLARGGRRRGNDPIGTDGGADETISLMAEKYCRTHDDSPLWYHWSAMLIYFWGVNVSPAQRW